MSASSPDPDNGPLDRGPLDRDPLDIDQLVVPPAAGFTAQLSREGHVAVICLSRPQTLNAQTPHTWTALAQLPEQLPARCRVVVVRGAGRAFSAGLDRRMFTPEGIPGAPGIASLAALPVEVADAHIARYQAAFGWLARPELTSIALVQGHAIGAGFQFALACDLRLVAQDVSFCMAEAGLGIVPDLGGTQRLVNLVGYSRAVELCLTLRRVGAEEALRVGLATAVVPVAGLDAAAEAVIDALLAVPREAASATKALLLAATGGRQLPQEAAERAAQIQRLRELAGHGSSTEVRTAD